MANVVVAGVGEHDDVRRHLGPVRLEETAQAAYDVHRNLHQGKVGVLTLAPTEGLGVTNPDLRAQHLTKINRFRNR